MTTFLRIPLITLCLSFTLLNAAQAQDTYEYAVVFYRPPITGFNYAGIHVSISGKVFETIKVTKSDVVNSSTDYTPIVNYIQGMAGTGWRVIATTISDPTGAMSFTLERKKTE